MDARTYRYESITLRVWLPELELAPPLTLSVWDKDYPDPGERTRRGRDSSNPGISSLL